MRFYVVDDAYIAHLKAIDARVADNELGMRPYLGVVLQAGGYDYFAPLTSPKPHHTKVGGQDLRFFKLHEVGNPQNALGMIRLVSMLPLAEGAYKMLNFKSEDEGYQRLLMNQIRFIVAHKDAIRARAHELYEQVVVHGNQALVDECSFRALEEGCRHFAEKGAAEKASDRPSAPASRPNAGKATLTLKPKS